jgi:hypothetical protein
MLCPSARRVGIAYTVFRRRRGIVLGLIGLVIGMVAAFALVPVNR